MKKAYLPIVIDEAIDWLRAGGIVVFPTETSYGIGCDATNASAVARIFALKGRPSGKGTPLLVGSLAEAKEWGSFDVRSRQLAETFWPGALTLIVPAKKPASGKGITSRVLQNRKVALRVSDHPVAQALAQGLGKPLVATSANRSGEPAAYRREELQALFEQAEAGELFFIDVGVLPKRPASTLVQVQNGVVQVLRQGPVEIPRH